MRSSLVCFSRRPELGNGLAGPLTWQGPGENWASMNLKAFQPVLLTRFDKEAASQNCNLVTVMCKFTVAAFPAVVRLKE